MNATIVTDERSSNFKRQSFNGYFSVFKTIAAQNEEEVAQIKIKINIECMVRRNISSLDLILE